MAAPPFATALILGIDDHVGAYLARLLHARGVGVLGLTDGLPHRQDAIAALGIGADIALVGDGDAEMLATAGTAGAIFAIAGDAARMAAILDAAPAATRLVHVVDKADLHQPTRLALVKRLGDLRRDQGRPAASIILHAHDSRLGADDTLPARVTVAAWRASQGEAAPLALAETGPCDWGWTPEYVDAVIRLAALPVLRDSAVASGHRLTTAEFVEHAFGFFRQDAALVTITGSDDAGDADTSSIAAALKSTTGWSASTHGRDLVRALCEGAAGRAG